MRPPAVIRPFAFLLALIGALIALSAGMWLGGHPEVLPDPLRAIFVEDERAVRAQVIDSIEDEYYRDVPGERLRDQASVQNMVRDLPDDYSQYFDPKQTEEFEAALEGAFEGVGMTVEEVDAGLRVGRVFEGSPAQKAGIRVRDVISEVNGRSIAGQPSEVSTARIKGRPGTSVKLTVTSPGERPRTVEVERARIEVPPAEGRIETVEGDRLGVVELYTFSSGAHGVLRAEVEEVLDQGAEGLVLDLRGNGGGLLSEAVLVSSLFVEDGPIVSTRGRAKPDRRFSAEGDAIAEDVPMVVLVDGGSASASEIVAGALQDRKRATLVGTPTFGKGVFQEVEPLQNGGQLSLTVGEYYLPSGRNIDGKGLQPDERARDVLRTEEDEAVDAALAALAKKAE